MKRNILLPTLLVALALAACNSRREDAPVNSPPAVEDKTVVADTVQKEGTSIKVSEDGMSIENKDGSKKTNVTISGDSSKVEIYRPK